MGGGGPDNRPHPFYYKSNMNDAAKMICDAITGSDFVNVIINGKAYTITPPTIKKMAGAISCLCRVKLEDADTLKDILLSQKDAGAYAHALSWLIQGDDSLAEELSEGSYNEVVDALCKGMDLISANPFLKAVSLTRNVVRLAAAL